MANERIHFVTGQLAEPLLREVVARIAESVGFEYTIEILPITVAALMTPDWIARHVHVPIGTSRIILPGYCGGDFTKLRSVANCPIELGPKDLRRLDQFFGQPIARADYGEWKIEIVAEINHASRIARPELIHLGQQLARDGADLIDLGCSPGHRWSGVGDAVRALRDVGLRVSIDSFDRQEVSDAVGAGAELVLSVHRSNCDAATDWGCEVVVIPERAGDLESLDEVARWLGDRGVPFRLDPVLDPIGVGFAQSLLRYAEARRRWPQTPMLMGIGNLTELSDADSAGINLLLLAICQEWSIDSVLTTQVINWARSSVRELDVARRLVRFAQVHRTPPKHVDSRLVMLRDPEVLRYNDEQLAELARRIRDRNYRVFVAADSLVVLGEGQMFRGTDAFELFDELLASHSASLDPSHAFYLGFELCKATIARQLSKDYRQDEALDWGLLTEREPERHRLRRRKPSE